MSIGCMTITKYLGIIVDSFQVKLGDKFADSLLYLQTSVHNHWDGVIDGQNINVKCFYDLKQGRKELFYLTMHSTHFIYGYMASVSETKKQI